jgi:hypothetical protein
MPSGSWIHISVKPHGSVAGPGRLSFQRIPGYQPPRWPGPASPPQVHLDLQVSDITRAEAQVMALGATRLPGAGSGFRVYTDPAGHPFCLGWETHVDRAPADTWCAAMPPGRRRRPAAMPRWRPLSRDRTRCPRCPASRGTTRFRHRQAVAARVPRRARPAVRLRPQARPGALHPRARCRPARQDAAGS